MDTEFTSFNFDAFKLIPDNIKFGTSTWTYPGWKGLVYQNEYSSEQDFKNNCLKEYVKFPIFRSVGIDHSFYKPLSAKQVQMYLRMMSPRIRPCSKVWEQITIPQFPDHPRYGTKRGLINPNFLNLELFKDKVLSCFQQIDFIRSTGPFIFQFPTISSSLFSKEAFFEKLDVFLNELPTIFRYAIEVRNPDFLTTDYFSILNNHSCTHCFNHWNYMPTLKEQMKAAAKAGGLKANFFVARLLTPRNISYQIAVERFHPYSKLQQPNHEMRKDVVTLLKRVINRGGEAFVIVNNRAEGNSPMTINEIGTMLAEEIS